MPDIQTVEVLQRADTANAPNLKEPPRYAQEFTAQVLEKADIANLPDVSPCHSCGGQENPCYTFTLAPGDRWLCRKCVRGLNKTDLDLDDPNHPLLIYVDRAMEEARQEFKRLTPN